MRIRDRGAEVEGGSFFLLTDNGNGNKEGVIFATSSQQQLQSRQDLHHCNKLLLLSILVPFPPSQVAYLWSYSQFHNSVLTNFYIDDNICLNEYNNKLILEYNYPNTLTDLAPATVVHYGLRSLRVFTRALL